MGGHFPNSDRGPHNIMWLKLQLGPSLKAIAGNKIQITIQCFHFPENARLWTINFGPEI